MRRLFIYISVFQLFILYFYPVKVFSQDLSRIGKPHPINVSGIFSINNNCYFTLKGAPRYDPYFWLLNGSLTLDVMGIVIPVSASLTSQESSFTQPFNQFGLSPKYKSVTLHAGYRSLQYGTYTLNGNVFLGVGIDIAPAGRPIKGSVMFGRFARAVAESNNDPFITASPAYERWGYGVKFSIGQNIRGIDFSLFRGYDEVNSIPVPFADSNKLKPQDNLVLGISARQPISKYLSAEGEYAFSAYNTDSRDEYTELPGFSLFNQTGFLFHPNISSQFNSAFNGTLSYAGKGIQLKLSYRRIDPEFKTMGAGFLNNDLEDITGQLSWKMFRQQLNITTGGGLQHNNLDNNLQFTLNRLIGNFSVSWMFSKKLNINFQYANFLADTRFNNQTRNVQTMGLNTNADSLNFNQVTSSAGGNIQYHFGISGVNRHNLSSNFRFQESSDNKQNAATFSNAGLGYAYAHSASGLSMSTSFSVSQNKLPNSVQLNTGPGISIGRQFWKKRIISTLSGNYLFHFSSGLQVGNSLTTKFLNVIKHKKNHRFNLDFVFLHRNTLSDSTLEFGELRASASYQYSF